MGASPPAIWRPDCPPRRLEQRPRRRQDLVAACSPNISARRRQRSVGALVGSRRGVGLRSAPPCSSSSAPSAERIAGILAKRAIGLTGPWSGKKKRISDGARSAFSSCGRFRLHPPRCCASHRLGARDDLFGNIPGDARAPVCSAATVEYFGATLVNSRVRAGVAVEHPPVPRTSTSPIAARRAPDSESRRRRS